MCPGDKRQIPRNIRHTPAERGDLTFSLFINLYSVENLLNMQTFVSPPSIPPPPSFSLHFIPSSSSFMQSCISHRSSSVLIKSTSHILYVSILAFRASLFILPAGIHTHSSLMGVTGCSAFSHGDLCCEFFISHNVSTQCSLRHLLFTLSPYALLPTCPLLNVNTISQSPV